LWENSQLYFSGGSLRFLEMTDNFSVVLAGGQIGEINAYRTALAVHPVTVDLLIGT
jgi:hypothetical protein